MIVSEMDWLLVRGDYYEKYAKDAGEWPITDRVIALRVFREVTRVKRGNPPLPDFDAMWDGLSANGKGAFIARLILQSQESKGYAEFWTAAHNLFAALEMGAWK